jgi:hypothetical protein
VTVAHDAKRAVIGHELERVEVAPVVARGGGQEPHAFAVAVVDRQRLLDAPLPHPNDDARAQPAVLTKVHGDADVVDVPVRSDAPADTTTSRLWLGLVGRAARVRQELMLRDDQRASRLLRRPFKVILSQWFTGSSNPRVPG